ncbi:MAG: ROK family protein [Pyrinomonadaceae bacterium]
MVSDGVGVGAVVNGELLRGHNNTAGEFGHTPLQIDGPNCLCGLNGCWEAYTSNMATLSRYYGRTLSRTSVPASSAVNGGETLTIAGLIARARARW